MPPIKPEPKESVPLDTDGPGNAADVADGVVALAAATPAASDSTILLKILKTIITLLAGALGSELARRIGE